MERQRTEGLNTLDNDDDSENRAQLNLTNDPEEVEQPNASFRFFLSFQFQPCVTGRS